MTKRDYYEVLGVSQKASTEEIKRSFRNKARHLHPDNQHSGDEAAFKELAEAYEVLSDDNKRAKYDRWGHEGVKGSTRSFDEFDFSSFAGFGIDDLIDVFFGGGLRSQGRHTGPEQGAHLKYDLEIEFLESVFGVEKVISIKRLEECSPCNGEGATPGSKITPCTACGGLGQVQQVVNSWFGQSIRVSDCNYCQGSGKKIDKPCRECRGEGLVNQSREFTVKVPKGIENGSRLRLSGAGNKGRRHGAFGDLYIIVHVDEHKHFIRDGDNIHIKQPISFALASLGGELLIPSVDGEKPLKIAAGTQTGTIIVIKDLGIPRLSNPNRRGDQIVHIQIETPTKLSREEKKLLQKFAELRGDSLNIPPKENEENEESSQANPRSEKKSSEDSFEENGNDRNGEPSSSEEQESSIFDRIVEVFRPKNAEEQAKSNAD